MSGEEQLTPQASPQNAVAGGSLSLGSATPTTVNATFEGPEQAAHTRAKELEQLRHDHTIEITKINNQDRTIRYFLVLLVIIVGVCLFIIVKPGSSSTMTTAAFGIIGTIVALIAGYVGGQKMG